MTSRIRLATNVLVLGYHHPLEIAKRYGTLDQVSGGRVILGLGVGSLEEEFELLGVPFDDRGPRADDALSALRVSLSERLPEYDGPYYRYSEVVLDPCARQSPVPLWIGGRTARSLRRAVELADGWVPFGIRAADVAAMLADARATPAWSEPDPSARRGAEKRPPPRPDRRSRRGPPDRAETARRSGPPACSCGSPTARWLTTSSNSRRWPASWASRQPEGPMNRVKVGFFSLSHHSPSGDDRPYLEWHQLDHMPEQYQLPGLVLGPAVGLDTGLPVGSGGRGRRLVAGRTRRVLPDGQSGRRDHRRVPDPGPASGRAGPVPPCPALAVPGRAPTPRDLGRAPRADLVRGGPLPSPPGHLSDRGRAPPTARSRMPPSSGCTSRSSPTWCRCRGWPGPGPSARPRRSGGPCSPRVTTG